MKVRNFIAVGTMLMMSVFVLIGCGEDDVAVAENKVSTECTTTTSQDDEKTETSYYEDSNETAYTTTFKETETITDTTETNITENTTQTTEETTTTTVTTVSEQTEEVISEEELDFDSLPIYEDVGGVDLEGEDNILRQYITVPGDGWYPMAGKFGVDVNKLLKVNNAQLSDPVTIGMLVNIPNKTDMEETNTVYSMGKVHILQHGETWSNIAIQYGVSLGDLMKLNNLHSGEWRDSGFEVKIPDYGSEPKENISSNSGKVLGTVTLRNTPGTNSWYNIKLSASRINGMTLAPGEQFSWFAYPGLGPSGQNEGFLLSTAYNGQTVVRAYGGGVCFTSTVLYQCAKMAGMTILEHWDHSLPVSYAARGDEAAINWGSKNNRFSNPTSNTVVFYTKANDCSGTLTITCVQK